jgi:hypothetical protein
MKLRRCTVPLTLLLLASACKADDPADTELPTTDPATTDPSTSTDPSTDPTTEGPDPTTQGPGSDPSGDPSGDPTTEPTTESNTDPTVETTSPVDPCELLDISPIDESACVALESDYMPRVNNSKDDTWPSCISDDGTYTQVAMGTPGSVARAEAYEEIADLLWRKTDAPTPEDFTAARDQYIIPEGNESRMVRREDFHYPPIPMAEWDPQVDADKQCTVAALVEKYPERCVGPSTLAPLIDEAFTAGQTGDGDARVHAARIEAALDWFYFLSVYKEAHTGASIKAADVDSAWAYYNGGQSIDDGIAIAAVVKNLSQNTHERIHDGILAIRCWRDLNQDMGMYPLLDEVDADSKALFEQAWEQLDQGLHRGWALVVRDRILRYIETSCGKADGHLPAVWAYVQLAGGWLQHEAETRDADKAAPLAALWAKADPSVEELEQAISIIDELFPCP